MKLIFVQEKSAIAEELIFILQKRKYFYYIFIFVFIYIRIYFVFIYIRTEGLLVVRKLQSIHDCATSFVAKKSNSFSPNND